MTHDELLQTINDKLAYYTNNNFGASGFAVALRSIVELHKPVDCEALDGSQGTMCINCCDGFYPCLTIETIEWNLNELRL